MEHLATDHAVAFQFPKLLDQHLLAHAADASTQLAGATRAFVQLADDHGFPLPADHFEGGPDAAVIRFLRRHAYRPVSTCRFGTYLSARTIPSYAANMNAVNLKINGRDYDVPVDPRATLLDTLRERLGLTGTKKGCDRGECGACTVHIDGRRALSCLTLAVMTEGKQVTTIEGLSQDGELHPVQAAFIAHDALQCGYCTPGQIMSAVALIREGRANSDEEIREFMSGNLCRCAAYPQIVAAVRAAASGGGV